jgi:hypothetical protein
MKKIILSALAIMLSLSVFSQDLVVIGKDTLNCKIGKFDGVNLYFKYKKGNAIVTGFLPIEHIRKYEYNFFTYSEIPPDTLRRIYEKGDFDRFRISLNSGLSYHLTKVTTQSYITTILPDWQKLRQGYNIEGDVAYYFNKSFGVGLKYIHYTASLQENFMNFKVNINYFGPSLNARFLKTQRLISNFSVGYLNFEEQRLSVDNYSAIGKSVCFVYEIGYDIKISKYISLGLTCSLNASVLNSLDLDNGVTQTTINIGGMGEYENITRLDLSAGIRFNK